MKDLFLVVLALICGLLIFKALESKDSPPPQIVYVTPPPTPTPAAARATPSPRARRLTNPGTFYLVDYTSIQTPQGVVGFEPGMLVRFVKADEEKETLTVTDGKYEVTVNPEQLTNDVDVADLVRRRDQSSQEQVMLAQTAALKEYQKEQKQVETDRARNVASVKGTTPVGARHNPLDEDSVPASALDRAAIRDGYYSYSNSPYYYLHRNSRRYYTYPNGY